MKILYYSAHPNLNLSALSGYGTHMREMIAAFRALGHEVHPVIAGGTEIQQEASSSTPQSGGTKSMLKKLIPDLIWQTLKDLNLMRFDSMMEQMLEEEVARFQPDLIYERLNYLQLSGINVAKKHGIKHFYEVNAPYVKEKVELEGRSLAASTAKKREHHQLQETDAAWCMSHNLIDYLVKQHQLQNTNRLQSLPNAIDPAKFQVDQQAVAELRKQLQLQVGPIIGFVGSIQRWHGVDQLIAAFDEIAPEFPDAQLLIVGSGEILQELKEQASQSPTGARITFTGKVPHEVVSNYISLMDITVMANSNWYGSPVKIFEYGALQKAIIAPDYGPVTEVMNHEEDGLIITPGSANLAVALRNLLSDAVKRETLAQNFHNKVKEQHTWVKNAERVIVAFNA